MTLLQPWEEVFVHSRVVNKKKALLSHLLAQSPDFIVLDNPFDALDAKSVTQLKQKLKRLSSQLTIIQLFKRKEDQLPFIKKMLFVENEKVAYEGDIEHFFTQQTEKKHRYSGSIPLPLNQL